MPGQHHLDIDRQSFDATPVYGFDCRSVDAVLNNQGLDRDQKRAILSSWASDLFAVESCPWLREIPGIEGRLRLSDILAALRALDDDPPRGGGAVIRLGEIARNSLAADADATGAVRPLAIMQRRAARSQVRAARMSARGATHARQAMPG